MPPTEAQDQGNDSASESSHAPERWVDRAAGFIHRWFLLLLLLVYALAFTVPTPGIELREAYWELESGMGLSLSQVLLATLLLLAGLGIDWQRLKVAFAKPVTLLGIVLLKCLIPLAALAICSVSLFPYSDSSPLAAGFAILLCMPAAASSPSWTQTAEGNVALSLAVLVGSTCAALILVLVCLPWVLVTAGISDTDPEPLQMLSIRFYSALWVILPPLAGAWIRRQLGTHRFVKLRPFVRLLASLLLLLLVYAFAAMALRQVSESGDWQQVWVSLCTACAVALLSFGLGFGSGRLLKASRQDQIAVIYGTAMFNNGLAFLLLEPLVPASSAVFLPLLAFSLVQHLLAGAAEMWFSRYSETPSGNWNASAAIQN